MATTPEELLAGVEASAHPNTSPTMEKPPKPIFGSEEIFV